MGCTVMVIVVVAVVAVVAVIAAIVRYHIGEDPFFRLWY